LARLDEDGERKFTLFRKPRTHNALFLVRYYPHKDHRPNEVFFMREILQVVSHVVYEANSIRSTIDEMKINVRCPNTQIDTAFTQSGFDLRGIAAHADACAQKVKKRLQTLHVGANHQTMLMAPTVLARKAAGVGHLGDYSSVRDGYERLVNAYGSSTLGNVVVPECLPDYSASIPKKVPFWQSVADMIIIQKKPPLFAFLNVVRYVLNNNEIVDRLLDDVVVNPLDDEEEETIDYAGPVERDYSGSECDDGDIRAIEDFDDDFDPELYYRSSSTEDDEEYSSSESLDFSYDTYDSTDDEAPSQFTEGDFSGL